MFSGGFRGGSGGSLEPPFGSKLFQCHGEMYEKSSKMLKTNPLLMDLNPPSRNPGSAPDVYSENMSYYCENFVCIKREVFLKDTVEKTGTLPQDFTPIHEKLIFDEKLHGFLP